MTATSTASIRFEPQPFDARFVGGPVFRLDAPAACGGADIRAALERAASQGARLIVARVPVASSAAQAVLESCGFRAIEHLVTFERQLAGQSRRLPDGIRLATADDIAACAAIGRASFRFDRYHADRRLDPAIGDAIKEAWTVNNLRGRADACFVATDSGRVVGFNQCLLSGEAAVIDLIAVATDCQGCGIGRKLTEAGEAHYAGRARVYRAGTQTTNGPAVGVYRKLGFAAVGEAITYHWVPCDPSAGGQQ